jgi:hypothetical protein
MSFRRSTGGTIGRLIVPATGRPVLAQADAALTALLDHQ